MDKNYMKALNIAENTLYKINKIYDDNASTSTFEDVKGCKATEKLIEDLEDFIKVIEHYSKDTQETYLELKPNGRYSINNKEVCCGCMVEVWNNNKWNSGTVEHSSKYGGYYFLNQDSENISLVEGIKARVRK